MSAALSRVEALLTSYPGDGGLRACIDAVQGQRKECIKRVNMLPEDRRALGQASCDLVAAQQFNKCGADRNPTVA